MTEDPVNHMWNLYKKNNYKGIMWVRILNLDMAFVGDFDTLKYIFNHPDAQERTPEVLARFQRDIRMLEENQEIPGVIMSAGKTWTEQRRFTLRTLRDFGFGKQGMEELIKEEVEEFGKLIKETNGKPFD